MASPNSSFNFDHGAPTVRPPCRRIDPIPPKAPMLPDDPRAIRTRPRASAATAGSSRITPARIRHYSTDHHAHVTDGSFSLMLTKCAIYS